MKGSPNILNFTNMEVLVVIIWNEKNINFSSVQ